MKKAMALTLLAVAGLFLVAGCGGKKAAKFTPLQDLKAPKWVITGSGAFGGEKGKVFYGVSSASGIRNVSMLRSVADNRARSEISKIFQVYTASLMKDYMASTIAGDPNVSSEEQHVEQAIKTVTANTLSGVEIVDHWQNPESRELYSLARLDLAAFKDALDKARELDSRVKEHIKKNAERLHDDLEREEEKLRR